MREAMFSARPMKSNPRVARPKVVTFETGRVSSPPRCQREVSNHTDYQKPCHVVGLCAQLCQENILFLIPYPDAFTPRSRRLVSWSPAVISFQFPFRPTLCHSYHKHSCSAMPVRFARVQWGRLARESPVQLGTRSLQDQHSRTCR